MGEKEDPNPTTQVFPSPTYRQKGYEILSSQARRPRAVKVQLYDNPYRQRASRLNRYNPAESNNDAVSTEGAVISATYLRELNNPLLLYCT